jgi:translation initiation factor IF-3
VNDEIRSPKVLLVNDEDAQEMSLEDALALAKEQELDLIEVSPKAKPPVVKIDDFGRHLYSIQKKVKKQRAHNKQTETKMLRFSFRTEQHDLNRIVDRAREFLAERHLVKLVVRLRGRELTNIDYAKKKLRGLLETLSDASELEQDVKRQGNQFFAIVRPKK